MESKEPITAEKFLDDYAQRNGFTEILSHKHQVIALVEFAKHIRKEMIEAIKEKARIGKKIVPQMQQGVEDLTVYYIKPDSIENAYREELIK